MRHLRPVALLAALTLLLPTVVAAQEELADPGILTVEALTTALERGAHGQLIPPRTTRQLVLGESGPLLTDTTASIWYDARRGMLRVSGPDRHSARSWPLVEFAPPEEESPRGTPRLVLPPRVVVKTPLGPLVTLELPDGSRFVTRDLRAIDTLYAAGDELLPTLVTQLGGLVPSLDRWAMERYLRKLAESPAVDSITRAFGVVERVVPVRESRPGILGIYYNRADRIELDPSTHAHEGDLLLTWVHEYAHALQRRRRPELDQIFRGVAPVSIAGIYGYGKRSEQQAEAISFAWGFLRATSDTAYIYQVGVSDRWGLAMLNRILRGKVSEPLPGDPSERVAEALVRLERIVPGTRRMAALLLTHEIWKRHPLRTGAIDDLAGILDEPVPQDFWSERPQPPSASASARNARARWETESFSSADASPNVLPRSSLRKSGS